MVLNHIKWIPYYLLRRYIRYQTIDIDWICQLRNKLRSRLIIGLAKHRTSIPLPQRISIIVVSISHMTELLTLLLECLVTSRYQTLKRFLTCVNSHVVVHRMHRLAPSPAHIAFISS